MRNFITCLFLIFITFSCQNVEDQKIKARDEALKSGIKIDSIFYGLTFNDSPNSVAKKLNYLSDNGILFRDYYDYTLKYSFSYPKFLNNIEWNVYRHNISFYNDSLYNFTLETRDFYSSQYEDCLACLDSLYSNKYGTPIRENNGKTLNWFKGNLNIVVKLIEFNSVVTKDIITISYVDEKKSLPYYLSDKILKSDNNEYGFELCYSTDYWNKYYEKKDKNLMDEASKGI